MARKKPTELTPVMARLPEGLRVKLANAAKRNGRSMNAEMIYGLEQWLDPKFSTAQVVAALMPLLDQAVAKMPVLPPPVGQEMRVLKALEAMGKITVDDLGQAMAMVARSETNIKEGADQ